MQMTGKSDNLSGSAKIIADAIRSSEAITVNAVRDRADVFVDTFATNDVDVADIRGMQSNNAKLGEATLIHVISERSLAARHGSGYAPAHAAAIAEESAIMGAETRTESGSILPGGTVTIDYHDNTGRVISSFELQLDENGTPK